MADLRIGRQVSRYQRLLIAYPRSHRQAYGPAMVQLFSDRLQEEHPHDKRLGLFTFWLGMLIDLGKSALTERTEGMMKGLKRTTWWLATAAVIAGTYLTVAVGLWVDRLIPDTVTLSNGRKVRLPSEPLLGDILFTGIVAALGVVLILGILKYSTNPRRGRLLMLVGLIPAAASGAVFFWFPPFWILTALAVVVIVRLAVEPAP
ncbi:MAG: hypothetical protein OER12_03130, partial [Acidimicrobiia bacterium]|nr:hypothetical protein [Acidimicrobiia bacterium]